MKDKKSDLKNTLELLKEGYSINTIRGFFPSQVILHLHQLDRFAKKIRKNTLSGVSISF